MKKLNRKIRRFAEIWEVLGTFKASWLYFIFLTFMAALCEGVGIGMFLPILNIVVSESATRAVDPYLPAMLKVLTNEQLVVLGLGILVLATLLRFAFTIYKSVYATGLVLGIRNRWREQLISDVLYDRNQLYESRSHGALVDAILVQTSGASKFILSISEILTEIIFSLVMLIIIVSISWEMTALLLCAFMILLLAVNSPLRNWSRVLGVRSTKISQRLGALLSEVLRGAREIRIFSLESSQIQLITTVNADDLKLAKQMTLLSEILPAINQIMVASLLLAGSIYIIYFSDTHFADMLPSFVIFVIVAQRLSKHATALMSKYVAARTKYPSFSLVLGLFEERLQVLKTPGTRDFRSFGIEITFDRVKFSHRNGMEVLRDFYLTIPVGTVVALVGESGSGKSTIADLLLRLREPDEGRICVDGVNIREFDILSWRRGIGYVSQTSFLFNMTIYDNISLGRSNATREEIENAARTADAHDFILGLPDGYDTNVGDAGGQLSGGQRQRIVLAQVLLRDPMLFVLDEPTSALDMESSRFICRTIHNLAANGRTVLLITHDMKVAEDAHIIVDLQNVVPSVF